MDKATVNTEENYASTLPKPFVFVLMPFKKEFDDIYKFGIKGAAEDAGAYAERVDEQNYTEGMLDRIYNQISKADVIVADMTSQNPNVYYEVGYAHALGKIVLLLTQKTEDIPFDFKHRPHTVYSGSIDTLRTELAKKIRWAITEPKGARGIKEQSNLVVSLNDTPLPLHSSGLTVPAITIGSIVGHTRRMKITLHNHGSIPTPPIDQVYLFGQDNSEISYYQMPFFTSPSESVATRPSDAIDGWTRQWRISIDCPVLLPSGFYQEHIWFGESKSTGSTQVRENDVEQLAKFRVRVFVDENYYDYLFNLSTT